ncbi:unnamed protein product [Paramecium primaurelia]|uniref:CBS domain-containing protein n=1 Tax=Paramecium primaurelia TaxID=5886 RepID=A0A8S1NVG1_PARPR|nr:unnamed protein product [Paramecium primaurelia]
MKHSQPSKEDLLKEEYVTTLTYFLRDSSVYDCLSINNQVSVVDMSLSLFDTFKIFIDSHVDEVLFWNQEIANYDGVFTQTDLIKTVLKCYYNVLYDIPNIWTTNNIKAIIEIENEEESYSPIKRTIFGRLTIDQFNQLLQDFKNISIKAWFNSIGENLHQNCLIKAELDENLNDVCQKFITENITRIIVIEKESKMISGIIQQKDILSFLVKGFSQYFALKKHQNKTTNTNHHHEQHELQMEYFKDQVTQLQYTLPAHIPVYDLFYKLIYIYKRNTIAIVDQNNKYLGLIDRRDFLFILKYQMFDILASTTEKFLSLIKTEDSKYLAYYIRNKQQFSFNQTIKQVVENLLLSPRGSLVCLDNEQRVVSIFEISDLFKIFVIDNQNFENSGQ